MSGAREAPVERLGHPDDAQAPFSNTGATQPAPVPAPADRGLGPPPDGATRLRTVSTERRRESADRVPGFDPDHFRETHPAFAGSDDAACQAAWREGGGPTGQPGTQAEHLARLDLPLTTYPTAFPWRFYTRLYPRTGVHRWAALAHFLREGFDEVGDRLPYGEDGASFLTAVGDRLTRYNHPAAAKAYELALVHASSPSPALRQSLAEAYGRSGMWTAALDLYERILEDGGVDEAALRGYANAAAARDAWPRLFARLPDAASRIGPAGDVLTRETTELYFAQRSRVARALYADRRRGDADRILAEAVGRVADLTAACRPAEARTAMRSKTPNKTLGKTSSKTSSKAWPGPGRWPVAVLADGIPESARRRLDRFVDRLARAGAEARVFDLGGVRAFEEALPMAGAAVLVRMPAWPTVVQALARARQLGVPTLYETDELTVDPRHAPPPREAFDDRIGGQAYEDLLFGVALYGAAARLCDFGLAPNRALAAHLDGIVAAGRSFVVRDSGPPGTRKQAGASVRLFLHAPRMRCVGPSDAVGAALLDALGREPRIALATAGDVVLDEAFAPYRDRIAQHGAVPDWEDVLRGCDVNLVPADEGEAADCLAVTGWLAAARFGIPTLAGRTRAYREALEDGVEVRLASGQAEWRSALAALVAAPDLRRAIAEAAARAAARAYSDAAAVEDCRAMIAQLRTLRPR